MRISPSRKVCTLAYNADKLRNQTGDYEIGPDGYVKTDPTLAHRAASIG